jgi:hypothetical protein
MWFYHSLYKKTILLFGNTLRSISKSFEFYLLEVADHNRSQQFIHALLVGNIWV